MLKCKIGVVDDEPSVRRALGRLLQAAGFEVKMFASGREFLESLRFHRPDCAIVDLHLPELTGLDVQQHLAREETGLPCIIMTGKDEPGVAEHVRASGAAGYLKKPLDQRALLAAISSAVPNLYVDSDNCMTPSFAHSELNTKTCPGKNEPQTDHAQRGLPRTAGPAISP